jgi:tripartite-type tricarboxylate transporter receptor subunit TctC
MSDMPALAAIRRRAVLVAPLGLALLPSGAPAQGAWPTRAVTIVEGFPPGGVTDITSRLVAERMARELGQPAVVDNRPGAATSVAAASVTRARNDGYTLLMGTTTLAINQTLQPNLPPREPRRELDPIGMVFRTSFILHVHPSIPARTVPELIAHARANPGKVIFGSPGVGSVSHLCLELFKTAAGIEIEHVPYRGGAPALLDVIAGTVPVSFANLSEIMPHRQNPALRIHGISSRTRNAQAPELAPIAEVVPDFETVTWNGLIGPAGLPASLVARLHRVVAEGLERPEVRARFATLGADPLGEAPEPFARRLAADVALWGGVVRAAGVSLQ